MSGYDWITRVGAHLPGREWSIPDGDGLPLDLTGFTAQLLISHPDRPAHTLDTIANDVFAKGDGTAFPNLTIATFTTSPWADIVTAWGKPLPARVGSLFIWDLVLTRSADSKIWELDETLRRGTVRILPARTAA